VARKTSIIFTLFGKKGDKEQGARGRGLLFAAK
jgi:hypothetical protein